MVLRVGQNDGFRAEMRAIFPVFHENMKLLSWSDLQALPPFAACRR